MGLFSDLFGKGKGDGSAFDKLKQLAETAMGELTQNQQTGQNAPAPAQTQPAAPAKPAAPEPASVVPDAPVGSFGISWGAECPQVPGQYTYNGTYLQYFEEVFRLEFPQYRVEMEKSPYARPLQLKGYATVCTFWNGTQKALVVELMSQNSSAGRLRRETNAAGIPYLRFYYDHPGWWNTKEYVVGRIRHALGDC